MSQPGGVRGRARCAAVLITSNSSSKKKKKSPILMANFFSLRVVAPPLTYMEGGGFLCNYLPPRCAARGKPQVNLGRGCRYLGLIDLEGLHRAPGWGLGHPQGSHLKLKYPKIAGCGLNAEFLNEPQALLDPA